MHCQNRFLKKSNNRLCTVQVCIPISISLDQYAFFMQVHILTCLISYESNSNEDNDLFEIEIRRKQVMQKITSKCKHSLIDNYQNKCTQIKWLHYRLIIIIRVQLQLLENLRCHKIFEERMLVNEFQFINLFITRTSYPNED